MVLPTGMSCALCEPPHDMGVLALHVLGVLSMRQLDRDVLHYSSEIPITVVPPLCPLAVSALDFFQTGSLIGRIARQTTDWLATGGLDRTGRCTRRSRITIDLENRPAST